MADVQKILDDLFGPGGEPEKKGKKKPEKPKVDVGALLEAVRTIPTRALEGVPVRPLPGGGIYDYGFVKNEYPAAYRNIDPNLGGMPTPNEMPPFSGSPNQALADFFGRTMQDDIRSKLSIPIGHLIAESHGQPYDQYWHWARHGRGMQGANLGQTIDISRYPLADEGVGQYQGSSNRAFVSPYDLQVALGRHPGYSIADAKNDPKGFLREREKSSDFWNAVKLNAGVLRPKNGDYNNLQENPDVIGSTNPDIINKLRNLAVQAAELKNEKSRYAGKYVAAHEVRHPLTHSISDAFRNRLQSGFEDLMGMSREQMGRGENSDLAYLAGFQTGNENTREAGSPRVSFPDPMAMTEAMNHALDYAAYVGHPLKRAVEMFDKDHPGMDFGAQPRKVQDEYYEKGYSEFKKAAAKKPPPQLMPFRDVWYNWQYLKRPDRYLYDLLREYSEARDAENQLLWRNGGIGIQERPKSLYGVTA